MLYMRSAASDYDDWETVYKNPGWGSKHLIPLLKEVRKKGSVPLALRLNVTRSSHTRFLEGGPLMAQMAHL